MMRKIKYTSAQFPICDRNASQDDEQKGGMTVGLIGEANQPHCISSSLMGHPEEH